MAIPTPVNGQITDAVTQANVKVLGDAPAMAMGAIYQSLAHSTGILYENATSSQQQLAIAALVEEIYSHQLHLTEAVLDLTKKGQSPLDAVAAWIAANPTLVEPTELMLGELWNVEVNDLSMIAVASRQLRTMVDGAAS